MCLASTFDDADDAIADFYLTPSDRLEKSSESLRMARHEKARRIVLPDYVENQGSYARIAKTQSKHEAAIHRKLKNLGLLSLTFLEDSKRNQLLGFFREASFERVNAWAEKMRSLIMADKRAVSCVETWEREGMFSF